MRIKKTITGTEPVTVSEMKEWLKVDFSDDDTMIGLLITNVRDMVEEFTGLSLIASTINAEYLISDVSDSDVHLPYPEHDSVTSVTIEEAELETTITGNNRKVVSFENLVGYNDNQVVEIEFTTTGYCPEGIKMQIKKAVAHIYENRETGGLPEGVLAGLMQYCEV